MSGTEDEQRRRKKAAEKLDQRFPNTDIEPSDLEQTDSGFRVPAASIPAAEQDPALADDPDADRAKSFATVDTADLRLDAKEGGETQQQQGTGGTIPASEKDPGLGQDPEADRATEPQPANIESVEDAEAGSRSAEPADAAAQQDRQQAQGDLREAAQQLDRQLPNTDVGPEDVRRTRQGEFTVTEQTAREQLRADVARDLDVDRSEVQGFEEVAVERQENRDLRQITEPTAPRTETQLRPKLSTTAQREIATEQAAEQFDVAPEEVQFDEETGRAVVEQQPQQERIFEEGSLLGDVEDAVAPEQPIQFQRESRPEQFLELTEARAMEEIGEAEDFVSDIPALGPTGVGLSPSPGTEQPTGDRSFTDVLVPDASSGERMERQAEFQAGAGAEAARFAEPSGIALLGSDFAKAGDRNVRASLDRKPEAVKELLEADSPTEVGKAGIDLANPVFAPTVDQTRGAASRAADVAPDVASDVKGAFEAEPVRSTGRAIGAAGALAAPPLVARGAAARVGRGARRATKTADEPLGVRTDLPEQRPTTIRAEDVDEAMGVSGPSKVEVTTGKVRRRLSNVREKVAKTAADVEVQSRAGAGLVPPKVTRKSRQTPDPKMPQRLDKEVLAGSPRDKLSSEITEQARTQRQQFSGTFERSPDPLAERASRRSRSQADITDIEEPAVSVDESSLIDRGDASSVGITGAETGQAVTPEQTLAQTEQEQAVAEELERTREVQQPTLEQSEKVNAEIVESSGRFVRPEIERSRSAQEVRTLEDTTARVSEDTTVEEVVTESERQRLRSTEDVETVSGSEETVRGPELDTRLDEGLDQEPRGLTGTDTDLDQVADVGQDLDTRTRQRERARQAPKRDPGADIDPGGREESRPRPRPRPRDPEPPRTPPTLLDIDLPKTPKKKRDEDPFATATREFELEFEGSPLNLGLDDVDSNLDSDLDNLGDS